MSYNLHLKAEVEATFELEHKQYKRTLSENCLLWQTPTEVTEKAMSSDNPLDVYLEYIRRIEPNDTETFGIDNRSLHGDCYFREEEYRENTDESSIPWEELEKVELQTPRKEHENNVFKWIEEHKGWKIVWYGM